ncbi:MAG: hypothetical protein ABSG42_00035 [Nitrospirota bacterium]
MWISQEDLNKPGMVNKRHLTGFRRFQNAALRALSAISAELKKSGMAEGGKSAVKVGDMKSLISAYKDAVVGERMVLGLTGAIGGDSWPDEIMVRWVDDGQDKESLD